MGDHWVIVGRDDLNSQILNPVVTHSHLRMEVYFRHLLRAPLPRQQRASPRQRKTPSVWSSGGVWEAAAAVVNVSSPTRLTERRQTGIIFWCIMEKKSVLQRAAAIARVFSTIVMSSWLSTCYCSKRPGRQHDRECGWDCCKCAEGVSGEYA